MEQRASHRTLIDARARFEPPPTDSSALPRGDGRSPRQPDEVEALGERIAEIAAHITAATWQLLLLLREFDEREGWSMLGFRSCAHWLVWRTGIDAGAAREKVRVARALGELPRISGALRRAELSYSKVRALTRVATAENEEELLHLARSCNTYQVERLVRLWRRYGRVDGEQSGPAPRELRSASWRRDDDGMLVLHARLEPEVGAVLVRALEAAEERLYQEQREREEWDHHQRQEPECDGPRPASARKLPIDQRRADALALVAEAALGDGLDAPRGDRYQVVVHVASDGGHETTLEEGPERRCGQGQRGKPPDLAAWLDDGHDVSAETFRRLACDASRTVMIHAPDGSVLDVGRKTRTVPPAIRRALEHRDRGCRFPGCHLPASLCEGHHIEHWADGGETRLDNLVLLCRFHHRLLHEEGFTVERDAAGSLRFRGPGGRPLTSMPPLPSLPADPLAELRAQHAESALRFDGETLSASQEFGRCDYRGMLDFFLEPPGPAAERRPGVSAETSEGFGWGSGWIGFGIV